MSDEKTCEEQLCKHLEPMARCAAGKELENARQVIRELREQREDAGKAFEEEMRASRQCEKDRVKADEEIARLDAALEKSRADISGLQLELDAARATVDADESLAAEERDAAYKDLTECRRVWQGFINDCAVLLGLPKMNGCSEYGGGSIRCGIEELKKKLDAAEFTAAGVIEGAEEWKDDCKTAQARVKELEGALGVRRETVEATMDVARRLVSPAWCAEKTEERVFDPLLAEKFAEILFPFLEALEFYGRLGNWQDMKEGLEESACEEDFGARARTVLGRPDREVPEIGDEEAEASDRMGIFCSHPDCSEDAEWMVVSGPRVSHWQQSCRRHLSSLLPNSVRHSIYAISRAGKEEVDVDSGTGGGPSGNGS